MNISFSRVGSISMLIYAVLTALSSMMIHATNQRVTPLLSAFYTFLFCLLAYNLVTKGIFRKLKNNRQAWVNILVLNITTAVSWIFAFFSLKYIQPELFLYIYLCAMPIASCLIYKTHLLKATIYFAGLIFLTLTYHSNMLLIGFLLAFIGGISGTVYSIVSKKITDEFSTLEILSLRFYLTVIITFFLSFYFDQIAVMDMNYYFNFAMLSLVSVICPLILFQVGIKNLTVVKALSYLPLAPLLCYTMNIVFNHAPFSWAQLLAILFMSIAMII